MLTRTEFLRTAATLMAVCLLQNTDARADDAPACTFSKLAELPIVELRDEIAIPVSVNGKTMLMGVDTGSPLTILIKDRIRDMNLVTNFLYGIDAQRGPGLQMTWIDDLQIGDWKAYKGRLFVGDLDIDDPAKNFVGVLGEDFLKSIDFEIDLKGKKFIVYHAEGCSEKSAPLAADSYAYVPFTLADPQYWARIMVNVEVNGQPVKAMFGTEFADTRVTEEAARAVSLDLKGAQPIPADLPSNKGGAGLWMAKLDSFKIGEEAIKPVRLRVGGAGPEVNTSGLAYMLGSDGHWQMVLGRDFLRAHRVLVSHSQRRLYYSYVGGPIFGREPAPQTQAAK